MLKVQDKNIPDIDYVKCLENQNAYMVSLFYAYQRISDEEKRMQEYSDIKKYYVRILQELTRITRSECSLFSLDSPDRAESVKISYCRKNDQVKDIATIHFNVDSFNEKIVRFDDISTIKAFDYIRDEHPAIKTMVAAKITVGRVYRGMVCLLRTAQESNYTDIDEKMLQLIVYELENTTERGDLIASLLAEREILRNEKESQQKLLAKLDEMQDQLVQSDKMASIGQLAAGVAHEINNPIGYVSSNMSSLEKYVKQLIQVVDSGSLTDSAAQNGIDFEYIKEDVFELIKESNEGVDRVRKIVQDLKDFSHVGEMEMALTNLNNGINSTLNIVNNELKYKADVIKNLEDIPDVECIASQINQVFMNLLVNAAHAIEVKGKIEITTKHHKNDWVSIQISDDGSGISDEDLKKIFNPFYTTKEIGKGTGLGLSIAYGIIQKHNGQITVSSELGEGTTFTIWLPVKQAKDGSDNKLEQ